MARAIKILNKYEIKLLALSDRDINYDNFYKEELIAFCKCLKEEYKKQKEVVEKIFNYLEDKYGYNLTKGTINDTDIDELYKILEEVSE